MALATEGPAVSRNVRVKLVVRHTFLEVVEDFEQQPRLCRWHRAKTDSALGGPHVDETFETELVDVPGPRCAPASPSATASTSSLPAVACDSDAVHSEPEHLTESEPEAATESEAEVAANPCPQDGAVAKDSQIGKRGQKAGRTTVMLRNLPNNYTRAMLLTMLDSEGFRSKYDFVYVPMDFKRRANLGYAFVNLVSPVAAQEFWRTFEGYTRWVLPTSKVCAVGWSEPHQGLRSHLARYRNSPVMHESVPDEFKPVVFADGVRRPFPAPTRVLPAPSSRN